jgi:hypothetical protein
MLGPEGHPSMPPMDLTRRAFLRRSVAAAAGIAGVGAVGFPALSSTPAPNLSPARRRDFRALVEALGASPRTLVDASRAGEVTAALAASYEARPARSRRELDALIDAIESGQGRPRFASLPPEARLAQLAKRMRAPEARRGSPSATCLLSEAVGLAAAPFYPPRGAASVPALVEAEAA